MNKITTGKEGSYFWLQVLQLVNGHIIERVPEVLSEKHLVITSFDSGKLVLTEEEIQLGFKNYGDVTAIPPGVQLEKIPEGGGDEWYIFDGEIPSKIQSVHVFVNWLGFHFDESDKVKDLQKQFWSQLEELKPESYLGDTNILLFATRNKSLFDKVLNSLGN